jgi:hypothetical protein
MMVGAGTVLLLAEGKKLDIGRGWDGFNDLFVYTYKAFSSVFVFGLLCYIIRDLAWVECIIGSSKTSL